MMAQKLITALIVATSLQSCAGYQDIQNKEPILSFTVGSDYQIVYRRMLAKARECAMAGHVIHGDLFQDIKAAKIIAEAPQIGGQLIFYIVDINAVSDSASRIVLRTWGRAGDKLSAVITKWPNVPQAECEPTT